MSASATQGGQKQIVEIGPQRIVTGDALLFVISALIWQLWNRAGHYIFCPVVSSSYFFLFSSSNLSRRRLIVYHTYTHGVALARI